MPESQSNDSYINASLFGTLTLIDPNAGPVEPTNEVTQSGLENIVLYPNPASETLYYLFNEIPESLYSYSIIDLAGQVLRKGSLDENSRSGIIDVKSLPKGTYIINFQNRMGTFSKRINLF